MTLPYFPPVNPSHKYPKVSKQLHLEKWEKKTKQTNKKKTTYFSYLEKRRQVANMILLVVLQYIGKNLQNSNTQWKGFSNFTVTFVHHHAQGATLCKTIWFLYLIKI